MPRPGRESRWPHFRRSGASGARTTFAAAVAYLPSNESSFLTGTVVPVDGGLGVPGHRKCRWSTICSIHGVGAGRTGRAGGYSARPAAGCCARWSGYPGGSRRRHRGRAGCAVTAARPRAGPAVRGAERGAAPVASRRPWRGASRPRSGPVLRRRGPGGVGVDAPPRRGRDRPGLRAGGVPTGGVAGVVTAPEARATVARQRRAQWRWVVLDDDGRLLAEGITRRRPTGQSRTPVRGGVVELQIPAQHLADLASDLPACGPWAGVVADISAQHTTTDPDRRVAGHDAHPEERFPRARLRRHVQIRDRHCIFRGSRTPARAVHQHAPGVFVWTSPLGRAYPVLPEPILPPAPEPVTRPPDPDHDRPADPTERPLNLHPRRRAPPLPPAPAPPLVRHDWDATLNPEDPTPF